MQNGVKGVSAYLCVIEQFSVLTKILLFLDRKF